VSGEIVFDASAMLTVIQNERGADRALAVMANAFMSSVNLAEVQTKLVAQGADPKAAWAQIRAFDCTSVPFGDMDAERAGSLVRMTRRYGLSLGDRACLALAIARKATVYTADRNWKNLSLGIEIEVIR
jgi:ribonuclease VapC